MTRVKPEPVNVRPRGGYDLDVVTGGLRRMTLCALFTLLFLTAPSLVAAHPAVGIVVDEDGGVFYSDTQQVWRIDRDGRRSVAVPHVHTHELWFDAEGNLFGEHLRYAGGRWDHRIWRRSRAGVVTNVIGARSGFREDYRDFLFARDARGAMYWMEGRSPAVVYRRAGGGPVETVSRLTLRDPVWLSATARGEVLLSSYGVVWRIRSDGRTERLPDVSRSRDRFAVMGMAEDGDGNVYVAAYADRAVRRISPIGEVATLATTPDAWGPTGVAIAPGGVVWVLEASETNAQRVRRIGPDGRTQAY